MSTLLKRSPKSIFPAKMSPHFQLISQRVPIAIAIGARNYEKCTVCAYYDHCFAGKKNWYHMYYGFMKARSQKLIVFLKEPCYTPDIGI